MSNTTRSSAQRRGLLISGFDSGAVKGIAAAAVGTLAMDALLFARARRSGTNDGFVAWETSAGLDDWTDAPAPALVAKRAVETVSRTSLAPSRARIANNTMHWLYGLGWGAGYGLAAERANHGGLLGCGLGPVVWASDYVTLPALGLYKPIWKYDVEVLLADLRAHVLFGLVTGATFRLLRTHR